MGAVKSMNWKSFVSITTLGFVALSVAQSKAPKINVIPHVKSGYKGGIVPGQIKVKFRQSLAEALEREPLRQVVFGAGVMDGARFQSRIGNSGWTLWTLPETVDTAQMAEELRQDPQVVFAEPVFRIFPLIVTPNDPDWLFEETTEELSLVLGEGDPVPFRRLWNITDIEAEGGWTTWPNHWFTSSNKPQSSPTIAVIDTGCDMNHPDFRNSGGSSTHFANGGQLDHTNSLQFFLGEPLVGGTPEDSHGHGTHVAGLALASGNNGGHAGMGMIGTGYNCKGMVLRVFDTQGNGSDADAAAAIYYAVDHGADILNLSIGTEDYSQQFQDAVTYAFEKGLTVVAAGNEDGNGGGDLGPIYPAACSAAMGVAANGPYWQPAIATYGGTGYYLDIAAPGGDLYFDGNQYSIQFVWSTAMRTAGTLFDYSMAGILFPPYFTDYAYLAGTSMATPQVSGAAGLYMGKNNLRAGKYNNWRVVRALQKSAYGNAPYGGWNYQQGYGSLDMQQLMIDGNPRNAVVGSIEGIVYNNTTPWALVQVRAKRGSTTYTTTTKVNGTYKFDGLPAGQYEVRIPAAGVGLPQTYRNVMVQLGCDTPNTNLHAWGTANWDENPPVIDTLNITSVRPLTVKGTQWGYDPETGVDRITMRIGTTPGGNQVMPDTEVLVGGVLNNPDLGAFEFNNLSKLRFGKYYLTATYRNGAQLTSMRSTSFFVGSGGGPR
ncbi:MAG TPA: S8 family serine peptidase [Fimbriimonadaceae bacterium]|nr:S8 family serine peptidase [Fimbriimonadaceae bacterium]